MPFNFIGSLSQVFKRLVVAGLLLCLMQAQVQADQITLNLKEADIRALISTVSKFTGKNFVIDPRVKAKVTVVSSKTMSEDEVYEVFLSILQVHGYAAVPMNNVIKIVPEVNAKQGPLPVVFDASNTGDELVTRVITLNHVPAAQLVPILRPLVPQQGHLAAYNPTNTLIITDHAANIKRLNQIIRSIDKPESDELEIIPLKHASATELVRILNSLNRSSGAGKKSAKKVTLAADQRTNSILMSGERATRLKIRATIAHLDTPLDNDSGNTHVIYLKYAKAEDMVKILTGVQKSKTSRRKGIKSKGAINAANRKNINIQSDEATNALIITAGPDVVRRMKSIIRQLDIRRAQVLVESIIAEISNNKSKELSSEFATAGRQGGSSTPVAVGSFGGIGGLLAAALNPAAAAGVISSGLNVVVGNTSGNRFGFLLKALSGNAATNILSTPSIVTLDNQEAEIVVGQNVPFVTGSFTNTGSASGSTNPFQTIQRKDVGITLKVTPQINDGDTIKLNIDQEISSVAASAGGASDLVTNKRTLKTTVLVEDGEILVLGGLIDDTARDTVQKVPILGDIPLLGALFRSHTTSKDKQNLMIFMRPSIMRDKNAAALKTNEKYNYLRAQQIQSGQGGFGLLSDETTPILPEIRELTKSKGEPESTKKFDLDDDEDLN